VGRAVIFGDPAITPLSAPRVDVIAAAKRDLEAGEILDGLGHYMTYGLCENAEVVHAERLVPIGLIEGCRLRRNVARDHILGYEDIEIPAGRLCDQLRLEQDTLFFGSPSSMLRPEATADA
jgi:predicted homoserine dehydrogenase-like protein